MRRWHPQPRRKRSWCVGLGRQALALDDGTCWATPARPVCDGHPRRPLDPRQDDDPPAMRRRLLPHARAACSNGACATASGRASWPRCSRCIPRAPRGRETLCGASGLRQGCQLAAHPLILAADLARKQNHGRGEAFASRTPASATPSRDPVAPRGSAAGSRLEAARVVLGCSE